MSTSYSERLLGKKPGLVAWQRNARFIRAAREVIAATGRVQSMLDVGAADGIGLFALGSATDYYVGLNYYANHSREFRKAHPAHPVVTGNVLQLPFGAGSFQAVVSLETLHFLATREARKRAMHEILRVLVPGGVFVCSVAIEVGLPAMVKYVGRRAAGIGLSGMTFGLMLKHCLHSCFDLEAYDRGTQVGFNAYQFAHDFREVFKSVRRIGLPVRYPFSTNLMLVGRC